MSSGEGGFQDDDLQPIRALNDLLFCERRCALHRIENVWTDNAYTLEGLQGHQRADEPAGARHGEDGRRIVRGMMLRSGRLGLIGKADVVEFLRSEDGGETPLPVEYKRGRRKKWVNDDVQLCAQALALEEMTGRPVPAGAVYHIKSKRRRAVTFTPELRRTTEEAVRRLHELVASGITPPPVWKPRCAGCSLRELCLPRVLENSTKVRRYTAGLYSVEPGADVGREG